MWVKENIVKTLTDKEAILGEKTYWELREYFTKEIELDNIIVTTDWAVSSNDGCGYVTDIDSIKKDFNEQMKETEYGAE